MNNLFIFPQPFIAYTDGNLTVTPLSMFNRGEDEASVWVRNNADGTKLNFGHNVFLSNFAPVGMSD